MPDSAFPSRQIHVTSRPEEDTVALTLRSLTSDDDYARCEALQEATWGQGFKEIASATMMLISQKVGGVAAGAFDPGGELRGLVFGVSGVRDGRPAHWSHILAVHSAWAGYGIGRHLKFYQRDLLVNLGIEDMYWSYDPLVARNAHLNLQRLAAEPVEYIENLYGDGGQNEQHRGLGTDRFIVCWRLQDPEVERRLEAPPPAPDGWLDAPLVNSRDSQGGQPLESPFDLPEAPLVRVEIPADIQTLKDESPETAMAWRMCTRRAFLGYLERHYRIRGFQRHDGRGFYLMVGP